MLSPQQPPNETAVAELLTTVSGDCHLPLAWTAPAACGRTIRGLMNSAHASRGGHDIPAAIHSPGHWRGHSLPIGLQPSPGPQVLTRQRLPESESASARLTR